MYFHVSFDSHSPGDVKPAGTYWNGVLAAGQSQTNDPDGEFLREAVRAQHFPGLPSRTRASFVFETQADAEFFRNHLRPGATIYRVRFEDETVPRHRVTYTAFQPASGIPMQLQAMEFWNGSLLYGSNIEVFAETDIVFL